jgi:biofilm protein TabA
MILGNISRQGIPSYYPQALRTMLEHFAKADFEILPSGKARLPPYDEDDAFFIVQRYDTRRPDEGKPECHRKYVDVQFIAKGREAIGWAPLSADNPLSQPYDASKDAELYSEVSLERFIQVYEGDYAVLGVEDVHRPCCLIEASSPVLKVVGKIRAELLD